MNGQNTMWSRNNSIKLDKISWCRWHTPRSWGRWRFVYILAMDTLQSDYLKFMLFPLLCFEQTAMLVSHSFRQIEAPILRVFEFSSFYPIFYGYFMLTLFTNVEIRLLTFNWQLIHNCVGALKTAPVYFLGIEKCQQMKILNTQMWNRETAQRDGFVSALNVEIWTHSKCSLLTKSVCKLLDDEQCWNVKRNKRNITILF